MKINKLHYHILGAQGNSCDDYYVLNDPTRNSEYGYDNGYCDKVDYFLGVSPGWKGPAWYRFAEPAGTIMPEEHVEGAWRCNAQISGWLNGDHPTTPGETIDGIVCFSASNGNACIMNTQIKIRHCNDYYLYYLEDVPGCNGRYCSSSTAIIGI